MRINTNIGALTAANNLTRVNDAVRSSAEKLSSGFRINKAADDAAGLGVANLFRSDIRALTQAQRNAEQANSVFQIAEGGAQSIQKVLERMKELAAQAASDSVDTAGRARIDSEFQGLVAEIDRVTATTEFQGSKLLNGAYGATTTSDLGAGVSSITASAPATVSISTISATVVQASANGITQTAAYAAGTAQTINFSGLGLKVATSAATTLADFAAKTISTVAGSGSFLIGAARNSSANYTSTSSNLMTINGGALDLTSSTLTVSAKDVTTLSNAQAALSAVDSALAKVNTALGTIGAGQNRLTNAIDNIKSTVLNYQAAESSVRDLDMADEMVKFSKNQIIAQAGTAMLAQANQAGQGVLQLLRG